MCNPKKFQLLEIRKGFTSDDAEMIDLPKMQLIIPQDKPEYSPALTKSLKCLDGRVKDPDGILGFPGGDFGIFALMLNE